MWNWGAFALEFAGSAILLFVALGLVSGGMASMPSGLWSLGGGIWLPFFIGTAVIASMALFFLSFANLTPACSCGCGCGCGRGGKTKVAAVAAGVTLVALTIGQAQLLMLVLLGFALAYIGTLVASTCACNMAEPPVKPKSRR